MMKAIKQWIKRKRAMLITLILATSAAGLYVRQSLPQGMAFHGTFEADQVQFLVDETWVDADGCRQVDQEIFASVFEMIDSAEHFILLDFFLLNDSLYLSGPGMRPLSADLTERLVSKRAANPDVEIIFITDPVNTVYGSIESSYFNAMEQAGVQVVWTNLDALRDSNPLFSKPWRLLCKHFGTAPGDALQNPLGAGRVSVRSFLRMLNFKANHRKIVVTEKSLLITSSNPHSASSAHWNTAIRIDGAGSAMACQSESTILGLSGAAAFSPKFGADTVPDGRYALELLTERRIKEKVLALLDEADSGTRVDLVMFYLSDKDVIRALLQAHQRGCSIRVILDPAKDAFGRTKNGIPNRQAGGRLVKAGIPLRWADTHGEQCHAKILYVEHADGMATLLQGSCNYTRRNMDNFNAECDVAVRAAQEDPVFEHARATFERWWGNESDRFYTVDYAQYEDPSLRRRLRAWLMERTGIGTF